MEYNWDIDKAKLGGGDMEDDDRQLTVKKFIQMHPNKKIHMYSQEHYTGLAPEIIKELLLNADSSFYIDEMEVNAKEVLYQSIWQQTHKKGEGYIIRTESPLYELRKKYEWNLNRCESAIEGIKSIIYLKKSDCEKIYPRYASEQGRVYLKEEEAKIALKYEIPILVVSSGTGYHGSDKGQYYINGIFDEEQLQKYLEDRCYERQAEIAHGFSEADRKVLKFCIDQLMAIKSKRIELVNNFESAYKKAKEIMKGTENDINEELGMELG